MRSVQVRWLSAFVLAVAVSAAVMAAPGRSGAAARSGSLPPGFTDTVVFDSLSLPTAVAFSPDGQVFVALKDGVIKDFSSLSNPIPSIFVDLSTEVHGEGDRGLLGLAVDPQFGSAGHNFVYALYTLDAPPGGTPPRWPDSCPTPPGQDKDGCVVTGKLVRIAQNPDGTAGSTTVLITGEWCQQFSSHSIGHLGFGPDGMLYVSGGEGASFLDTDWGEFGGTLPGTPTPANPCGDPPGGVGVALTSPTGRGGALRAQSLRRPAGEPVLLSGALLRINPKNGAGVRGNPTFDKAHKKANASRIIAYGFRNPYRFAFRPGTNEIWVGDVGMNTWEEVDRVRGPKVKPTPNYGWPCYEGAPQSPGYDALDMCQSLYTDSVAPAIAPYYAYNHSSKLGSGDTCTTGAGSSVISAIGFAGANSNYPSNYKGSALYFGDHSRNCIWVMSPGANGLPSRATLKTFVDDSDSPRPVDIETDPVSGDLFYVNLDRGEIHRISYTAG